MYLSDIAATIRSHVPDDKIPKGDVDRLFLLYAMLLRAKGTSVTRSDVHDAWCAWMLLEDPDHAALIPFEELSTDVQQEDRPYVLAIRKAFADVCTTSSPDGRFFGTLFPTGPPEDAALKQEAFELYKIMVESSERLVGRRQAVNTFFLTINGALLTASGLIIQNAGSPRLGGIGVAVLGAAGLLLCTAWWSLIGSFGQLNRGKFRVINSLERYFSAAIYAAEWEALDRGENPKTYRSFTDREIWVPKALMCLHLFGALFAAAVALGFIDLNTFSAREQ